MIEPDKIIIPVDCLMLYNKYYRRYHRIKYLTDISTEFGSLGVMITKKKTFFVIHVFFDGFYFKYPKKARTYEVLNRLIEHAIKTWYKRYEKKLIETKSQEIYPFEFYNALDKLVSKYAIGKRDTKRIMTHYILAKDNKHKFIFYDCINILVNKHVDITDNIEPFVNNMIKWVDKFPYDRTHIETLNLKEFTIKGTDYGYVRRLPYNEFCDIIKDWTDDEKMELLSRYKHLAMDDYKTDINRLLFREIQKKIEGY